MAATTTFGSASVARRRAAKAQLSECALLGLTLVVMFVLMASGLAAGAVKQ